jgi:hypothetical protein
MTEPPLYAIRVAERGDHAFIATTWALSADDAPVPWWTARKPRLSATRALANMCVQHARVVVLCSPELPSAVMGWACAVSGHVLHAYVRPAVRSTHLGRDWSARLLDAAKEGTG